MIGYSGSITKKTLPSVSHEDCWSAESNDHVFKLKGAETCTATLDQNGKKLLLLGMARRNGRPFQKDQKIVLGEILDDYEKSGELKIDGLEGSFTVFLADPEKERMFLFRNLVGSSFAYYTQTEQGVFFGNNLAEVARNSKRKLSVANEQLPIFFIFRFVQDSYTLFDEIFRIRPGEILQWKSGQVQTKRIQTIADYLEPNKTNEKDSIDRYEATSHEILKDWYELNPNAAVLLSGGVDSTLLQVQWNSIWREHHDAANKPKSAAVVLDHPHTKPDVDYTMSAVEECGTEHLNVSQPILSADFMTKILSKTGEMPNHVQSFYFWTLAQGMKKAGFDSGICGVGADGLFGAGASSTILKARHLQRTLPSSIFRASLACLLNLLKPNNGRSLLLTLSCHIDDLNWESHPLNQSGIFTNTETLHRLFSENAISNTIAFRHERIQAYGVPSDPDYLQWTNMFVFFFGGINTAAYWGQMFSENGMSMYSPFQDSRMIRMASNIDLAARFVRDNPKQILKKALLNHVSENFANRPKLSFGQPVFEWMSPGGCLRDAVENIADYPFMPKKIKQEILDKPNWILWDLLCFDIWHKEFIG